MNCVRVGPTGFKVSRICLGCMKYGSPKGRDEMRALVDRYEPHSVLGL